MNSSSPVATGAAAVTGAMLGGVISWLCTAFHVDPPPAEVAATIGALLLTAAHYFVRAISPAHTEPSPRIEPVVQQPAPIPQPAPAPTPASSPAQIGA